MAEQAPAVQPENAGAWANATKGLLGNAKSVTDELFAALKDKEFVRPESPKLGFAPFVDLGPKNKAELDEKLGVTRYAQNTVDTAIQHAGQCLHHLNHERQRKWAALKVCEWRISLREHRPPQELFKDHVQEALENEHKTLIDSRQKLSELVAQGRDISEDCEANRHRLTRNIHLMVQLGTARNLPPLVPTSPKSASNGPPSPEPASPKAAAAPAAEGEEAEPSSPKAKPVVPSDPAGLLRRAPQIEEIVRNFVAKGEKLIRDQRRLCDAAHERVLACFQKRWAENEALKKSLEQQIADMGQAIYDAEKGLSRMKKRIDHFKEVELQPKYDAAQVCLEKLRVSKSELEDDFLRKIVSMKIDESCRKITPERTGVPPDKMPVTNMMDVMTAKKQKRNATMKRVSSSPALLNETGGSQASPPISPAGASSPLKAAAAAALA